MTKKAPTTATYYYHNENPSNRKTGDCVLRSIAVATGQTWDKVLDDLVEIAHKRHIMIDDVGCYGQYLERLGWTKMKQPRKFDNTKYTGKEFCRFLEDRKYKGPVLAHIGGHHITVFKRTELKCFKCCDIWDCTNGCIGNYWIQ